MIGMKMRQKVSLDPIDLAISERIHSEPRHFRHNFIEWTGSNGSANSTELFSYSSRFPSFVFGVIGHYFREGRGGGGCAFGLELRGSGCPREGLLRGSFGDVVETAVRMKCDELS